MSRAACGEKTPSLEEVERDSEAAGAFYDAMAAAWNSVQEAGAGIALCLKGEDERGCFNDTPVPVILYHDSLKAAIGSNSGMIEDKDMPNAAAWYVNGSFRSAWLMALDAKELLKDVAVFAAMGQKMNTGGNAQSDSGAATSQNDQEASASGRGTSGANVSISSGGSSSHCMAHSSGASEMVPMG